MNRTTLGYMAIGVVVLMMLVIMVGGGGLPRETRTLVDAELTNFTEAQRQFETIERDVTKALEEEPELFALRAFDERWPRQLEENEQSLNAAAEQVKTVRELREKDDPEDKGKLVELVQQVAATRVAVLADSEAMRAEAQRWLDLKRNLPQTIEKMESDYRVVQGVSLDDVRAKVAQAQQDWPNKQDDLAQRLESLENAKTETQRIWNETEDMREAAANDDLNAIDFGALATSTRIMDQLASDYEANVKQLSGLVDQLYVAWDRVLADMEIREGELVTFHHKYRTITTKVPRGSAPPPAEGEEPTGPAADVETTETWQTVTEAKYKQMEKNLGMTIAHKSAGMYDHEASSTVQPPGYAYMAKPEQRRNRYGYWRSHSGGSFWVWYGQYALMRDVLWGPSWRDYRVSPYDYRTYDNYRSTGRTYYGRTNAGQQRYGSSGSLTRKSYSSAKYVRTDGFKSSRYKTSGGAYRGSRFERSSSRGYSSGRSGRSTGRSGSRFGGGK